MGLLARYQASTSSCCSDTLLYKVTDFRIMRMIFFVTTALIGIEVDVTETRGFRDKGIGIELLSDAEGVVCSTWCRPRKLMATEFGVCRSTFVIDNTGAAACNVNYKGHAAVLRLVKALDA